MTHRYQIQQDVILRKFLPADFLENAMSYQPTETDTTIVGCPRSGTTWVAYILYLLKNEGEAITFTERLWEDIPEIGIGRHVEHKFGKYFVQLAEMASHPRILRSHLPYEKTPIHPRSKCIYISRNPFDTAVSLFEEIRTTNEFSGAFNDFFTYFLHGQTDYNDYFQHHKGWLQRKTNQYDLWITYEDLVTYPRTVIKQIGDYLGGVYQRSANDEFTMSKIIKESSFSCMKAKENIMVQSNPNRINGYSFFRRGCIGDYRVYFSKEQITRLNEKFNREFNDTSLLKAWKGYKLPISNDDRR